MILKDLQELITGQSRKRIYKIYNYILKSGDSHFAEFPDLTLEVELRAYLRL